MPPPNTQLFLSGVLADRESPEQPFVAQSKEQLSQTHVRLTGAPRTLVTQGEEGDSTCTPGQLGITRCMHVI